ncbi:MAG: glycosyltransferase family 2 protein [Cyanobacteria bacterium SIG30]|nr:glycosyltransferase family 2 protein [Cyanobacteria bacterium SIG30]
MGLYLIFCYVFVKLQRRRAKKYPVVINENYKPFISILIPCHNEENVIEDTVKNILRVDWEDYEIILIDDRSEDSTPEILKRLTEEYEKVNCLIRDKSAFPGKSAVLNDAMKLAKGEAILVFDADAKIDPDFIKKMVPKLEAPDVGAVQSRKMIINAEQNFLTRCQYEEYALDTHMQVSRDAVRGAVELRGNGELIKRRALEDIGFWNNETITDDLDMSTRMHIRGWDIRYCLEAVVYEEGVLTYGALIKQRRRWVEGSIRRYLEYMWDILLSKDMSFRVTADLIIYITEFLLPFWVVSEIFIQAFRYVKGADNTILSSMIIIGCMAVLFAGMLFYSLRKYTNYSFWEKIRSIFATTAYLIIFWTPVVLMMILKIIFTEKTMDWGKTEHGVIAQ